MFFGHVILSPLRFFVDFQVSGHVLKLKISLLFSSSSLRFFVLLHTILPRVTSTWQFTNVTNTFSWHSFKGEKQRKVRRLTLKHRVLKKGTTPTNSAWHIRISNVYLYLFSRTFMRLWAIKSNFLRAFLGHYTVIQNASKTAIDLFFATFFRSQIVTKMA